jgi:ribosomal protein L37AE/L43A
VKAGKYVCPVHGPLELARIGQFTIWACPRCEFKKPAKWGSGSKRWGARKNQR